MEWDTVVQACFLFQDPVATSNTRNKEQEIREKGGGGERVRFAGFGTFGIASSTVLKNWICEQNGGGGTAPNGSEIDVAIRLCQASQIYEMPVASLHKLLRSI